MSRNHEQPAPSAKVLEDCGPDAAPEVCPRLGRDADRGIPPQPI